MGGLERRFLRGREIKQLEARVHSEVPVNLSELLGAKLQVEWLRKQKAELFLVNGKPLLQKVGERIIPTLIFDQVLKFIPKVIVDMGAVPHLCNGADIMAPGVVKVDGEFRGGSLVVIVDERYNKPLAIGVANVNSAEMKARRHGKVVKNMHYVGDFVWEWLKSVG